MLCVFDVNETLLDLAPLDELFAELTGSPTAGREWFDLVIHTALTITASGGYRNFAEIAGSCADTMLARHNRPTSDHQRQLVGQTLRTLPAHPEVPDALQRLREAGLPLVALTNSPLATAEHQLHHAGIIAAFDQLFSAEQASALKPAPPAYRLVADAYQADPGELLMIAAHDWDIAGAHAARMQTAFLERPGHHPLPGSPPPTFQATDLDALADQIINTSRAPAHGS